MTPVLTQNPADFGRVAVAFGGAAAEREVSLKSGAAVLSALQHQGVDAHAFDPAEQPLADLGAFDRVFIVVHGRGGEDGTLQGALELMNVPYTGSGVLGCAVAMDKLVSKRIWQGMGLPTPGYRVMTAAADADDIIATLGVPLMVKPAQEGSSIGMHKVYDTAELVEAFADAQRFDDSVLVEQFIAGDEYTAGMLGDTNLPLIKLQTSRDFYDYQAKYQSNDTQYLCPCGLAATVEGDAQQLAREAFEALGTHGWGRVDFMRDADGQNWLLEVNTVPGMTDHSLVPMAAKAAGVDFDGLVWRILETTLPAVTV